jgi:flagellar basal-body rod modification protein FlgD
MSDVSALGGTTTAISQTTSRQQGSSLDQEAFLQLLITQMKTQDPTKPMESTEYMSQLASFSQVEQSVQLNTKLDSLLASSALSLAESVIGRTITSADGKISGEVVSVKVTSDGPLCTLADGKTLILDDGVVIG